MSLVNIVNDGNAIHVFTDAGVWGSDGNIIALDHKGHILPHLHAVVSSRGDARLGDYITRRISVSCVSFDQAVERLSAICKDEYYKYRDTDADLEYWIAGYSTKKEEVQAYGVCNEGLNWLDHNMNAAPWELARVHGHLFLPFYAPPAERPTFEAGPIDESAIALAEWQRRMPVKGPRGADVYSVAGFLQQTTVSAYGVFARVIHRWPDVIGERVNPFISQ